MMRRFALRTIGVCAAAFLAVSCSDNTVGPLGTATPQASQSASAPVNAMSSVWTGPAVVISQVYGGASNGGAVVANDFVELFNPGEAPVNIGGWSIQYASATGTSWAPNVFRAGTTIQPGRYFLIKMTGPSGSTAAALPSPDTTFARDMAGVSGKVVLRSSSTALPVDVCPSSTDIVDHVAYGAASCTTTWGNTPALSGALAAVRGDAGCAFTGLANNDFTAATPTPRNSASAPKTCGTVVVNDPVSVSLTPITSSIDVGGTQNYVAIALDANGQSVGTTFTWSSSNTAVASVNAGGVASALGEGTTVITVKTANNVTATATLVVNLPPVFTAPDIVISQVYGGGGNASATYNRDFVELFNRGTTAVAIGGWSVQYAASGATSTWSPTAIPAGVTLLPGQYYLIGGGSGSTGVALPAVDVSGSINMSGTAGKVLLAKTSAPMAAGCPTDANVVDRMSFGTGASCNTAWGASPAPSNNTTSMLRAGEGCTFTSSTVSDFATGAVAPRNTGTPRHPCFSAPTDPIAVSVTPSSATVQVDATINLTANAVDATAQPAPTTFTWTTSNAAVATVNATGVVTGVAVGTATITATSANGIAGTAAITVTAATPPSSGIVITEVLSNPDGDDTLGEWFEVFNSSSVDVNLQGWEIRSARSGSPDESHIIASSVVVPAGGFAVIGTNANTITNGGINVAYVYPSDVVTLSNSSTTEWLLLRTSTGATADSIAYAPRNEAGTVVNPTYVPVNAIAREVIDASADNTTISSSNWRDATLPFGTGVNKGTPGYGAYGVAGPVARIAVSPSPASVMLGGTRAMTAIALDALGRISSESLEWSSSNDAVASIQVNGIVSGHQTGTVTITARAASGVQTLTSLIVVDPDAPANITVSVSDPGWIPVGFQRSVFSTVRTTDGRTVAAPLTYSVSNPGVLAIDVYNGRTYVRGVGAGTAELRATAPNGAFGIRTMTILPATAPTTALYRNHIEFGAPTDSDPSDDIPVAHAQYVASYNPLRGGPNWVSWNLNASHFGPAPRCNCFSVDQSLPAGVYRVSDPDYINSDYDRGHMVQSESRTGTEQENAASFLFTNILPQAGDNNQAVWLRFEEHLNSLAQSGKEVYIVAGGEYAPNAPTLKNEGKIAIPDFTWKVAIVMPAGQGLANVVSRENIQVLAVRMPNLLSTAPPRDAQWPTYETTVDNIEARVGYDLFAALPDDIERFVEANNHAPVAAALAPIGGIELTSVQMTGSASDPDANDPLTYSWSFGDGSTGTGANVTHTYGDIGTFDVRLIVTDSYGSADTTSTTATIVTAPAPTATFNATETVAEGSAASLSFADIVASAGSTITFAFDCGNGYGGFTAQPIATCSTSDNGTLAVRGKVRNQRGKESEYSAAVSVTNVAPTATILAPASVIEGSSITVSLTGATDVSTADIAAGFSYAFDCGSGMGAFGATASITCSTSDNGDRTIGAAVRDKDGDVTTYTTVVAVSNAAPVVAVFAGATILEGETYAAAGSFTDVGADSWTATVSYGNSTAPLSLTGTSFALSNLYATQGVFAVTVNVTDDDGSTGSRSATVTVQSAAQGATSLNAMIAAMANAGDITTQVAGPWTQIVNNANSSLQSKDNAAGVNQLNAFKNQVAAAIRSGRISAANAALLTALADRIIASANR